LLKVNSLGLFSKEGNYGPCPKGSVGALGAFLFLFPCCSAKNSYKVTIPIAAAGDIITTEMVYAQSENPREVNPLPFASSTTGRIASKTALAAYVIWLCHWLDKNDHHTAANWVEGFFVAWNATAITWNLTIVW
jgi:hypothetical protein